MAFKKQQDTQSNKRKRIPGATKGGGGDKTSPKKKLKTPSNNQPNTGFKKPFDSKAAGKPKFNKSDSTQDAPKTKRELRIQAKELAEARKKKRRPHYTLEQELALLWEKMRRRNIAKEDRSKLISDALRKMKGKIPEIAGSHVSCRVLQPPSPPPETTSVFSRSTSLTLLFRTTLSNRQTQCVCGKV